MREPAFYNHALARVQWESPRRQGGASATNLERVELTRAIQALANHAFGWGSIARVALYRRFVPIGEGAVILSGFKIRNPQKVRIGKRFYCNYNFFVQGAGGVKIGDDVIIGPNVSIFSENHEFSRRDIAINRQGMRRAPVRIGDDVWIGAGVTILPGVTIGNGCVIAAGAVVTRDISEFLVAGGVPARVMSAR